MLCLNSRFKTQLARLLKLPVDIKYISIKRGEHRTPELLASNPLAKVFQGFSLWCTCYRGIRRRRSEINGCFVLDILLEDPPHTHTHTGAIPA